MFTMIDKNKNSSTRKKLNGIWNALSAVKLKPAIYAKIPDV
jgi:hypothetical protein